MKLTIINEVVPLGGNDKEDNEVAIHFSYVVIGGYPFPYLVLGSVVFLSLVSSLGKPTYYV